MRKKLDRGNAAGLRKVIIMCLLLCVIILNVTGCKATVKYDSSLFGNGAAAGLKYKLYTHNAAVTGIEVYDGVGFKADAIEIITYKLDANDSTSRGWISTDNIAVMYWYGAGSFRNYKGYEIVMNLDSTTQGFGATFCYFTDDGFVLSWHKWLYPTGILNMVVILYKG